MTKAEEERRKIQAFRELGCTDEEIRDALEYDKRIDKGDKTLGQLDGEGKQVEKSMRRAERTKTPNYTFTKRERKPDEEKRELISMFDKVVSDIADEGTVNVTNVEREIEFLLNGRRYRITLSAPRK